MLVMGNYYVSSQNAMLSASSDTKRKLMHLFLFTNSAQRELVSICTQSIRNCNLLSLHHILGWKYIKYLVIKVDPASFMGEGEPDIEELLIAYESQKNVIQQLQVNTGQLQVSTGQLQVKYRSTTGQHGSTGKWFFRGRI